LPAQPVAERAAELELRGQFKEAAALLQAALADPSLEASNRHVLRFELDRLDRIRKDFPYTAEELFDALKKSVKDLTREEYDRWVAEGRFDSRVIDGERRFMTSSVSNLFWRYPELNPRRMPPKDTRALEKARWEHCVAIRQAAVAEKKPLVLPNRFRMTMKVTAKPGAAPAGEMVRAWLPIPREYPFQTDFTLITSTPRAIQVAPADSPIRSVFLEQPARKNQPTVFEVVYDYTTYGVWFQVDPALVKPCERQDPVFETYTREAPHVVFTPEIRALSETIAGSETNGFLKAKMFHDWIAENIQYSYAIEYSTIRNISDYCRARRYGDCGQEALLFITLCRLNGIPPAGNPAGTRSPRQVHSRLAEIISRLTAGCRWTRIWAFSPCDTPPASPRTNGATFATSISAAWTPIAWPPTPTTTGPHAAQTLAALG
jgi:hypothetical protein